MDNNEESFQDFIKQSHEGVTSSQKISKNMTSQEIREHMNQNFSKESSYSAEDIARINAIDLSDPNSIAAINSIDNTIGELNSSKIGPNTNESDLPTSIIENGKILLSKTYGRVRWVFVWNPTLIKVERELQQEVITQYLDEPAVTEYVTVPYE